MSLNPYIKPKFGSTTFVMLDVIIALLPLSFVSYIAYGFQAINLQLIAIGFAIVTELLAAFLFTKNHKSIFDGSAIITALLMCFTLSPATPWYIVAFGATSAILFGKILWGGLGKNRFNPALVGREFMASFFPAIMTSAGIWSTSQYVNNESFNFFPGLENDQLSNYLSEILYKTGGAMGEYSILAILIGGLYLLLRKRISWHVPFSLLLVFTLSLWIVPDTSINYSMSGLLLGTIFMATDMPSSPSNVFGKLYYGGMIGLVACLLILGKVSYEYMSFSILILNGFSRRITTVFATTVWGKTTNWKIKIEEIFLLTLFILGVTSAVITLNYYDLISYLIFIYIIYMIFKFNFSFIQKITHPI